MQPPLSHETKCACTCELFVTNRRLSVPTRHDDANDWMRPFEAASGYGLHIDSLVIDAIKQALRPVISSVITRTSPGPLLLGYTCSSTLIY